MKAIQALFKTNVAERERFAPEQEFSRVD